MANVKIYETLDEVKNLSPKDGEISGFRNEEGKIDYKIYINNNWQVIDFNETGLKLNLYDLNQQIIPQLPDLSKKQRLEKIQLINTFVKEQKNEFYMLYGKNMSYFTVFKRDNRGIASLGVEALCCLDNLGNIKSIEQEAGGIEFWIVKKEDNIADCLYLFPYDMGIIFVKD